MDQDDQQSISSLWIFILRAHSCWSLGSREGQALPAFLKEIEKMGVCEGAGAGFEMENILCWKMVELSGQELADVPGIMGCSLPLAQDTLSVQLQD